jgi:hypothetical protein
MIETIDPIVYEEFMRLALSHLDRGLSAAEIEEELRKKSEDIVLITVVIKDARSKHYERMQKSGSQIIIVGSVLGLLGFLMTILHFGSGTNFEYALFGFTGTGISLVFYGLYRMFG